MSHGSRIPNPYFVAVTDQEWSDRRREALYKVERRVVKVTRTDEKDGGKLCV